MYGGTSFKIKITGVEENEMEVNKAGEIMQLHIRIRADLPKLLARVALAGHSEKALNALVAWGTGKQSVIEIWEEMDSLVKGGN